VLTSRSGDPLGQPLAYRDAVERWRRAGSSTFLWVTRRNLADPLDRLGAEEAGRGLPAAARAALHGGGPAPNLDAALSLALGTIEQITDRERQPAGGPAGSLGRVR
jgi:hypothetical protein